MACLFEVILKGLGQGMNYYSMAKWGCFGLCGVLYNCLDRCKNRDIAVGERLLGVMGVYYTVINMENAKTYG